MYLERPKPALFPLFSPIVTLTIGLSLVLVIGTFAIVLIVRCTCGKNNNKRKDFVRAHGTTVRTASPGPSDKSATSKEIDGNESDEKNPDVIPDTIESDEQVYILFICMLLNVLPKNKQNHNFSIHDNHEFLLSPICKYTFCFPISKYKLHCVKILF